MKSNKFRVMLGFFFFCIMDLKIFIVFLKILVNWIRIIYLRFLGFFLDKCYIDVDDGEDD